ncbi:MAG: hypothetical protein IJF22_02155 [Clostridia bacterium]|nr:hypothetical protein [Clostridia bacterium]
MDEIKELNKKRHLKILGNSFMFLMAVVTIVCSALTINILSKTKTQAEMLLSINVDCNQVTENTKTNLLTYIFGFQEFESVNTSTVPINSNITPTSYLEYTYTFKPHQNAQVSVEFANLEKQNMALTYVFDNQTYPFSEAVFVNLIKDQTQTLTVQIKVDNPALSSYLAGDLLLTVTQF